MNDQRQDMDLAFNIEHLPESPHMCLIYDSEEQRQKMVSEYLAAGLAHGEVVRYAADETSPEQIRSWILEMGVEIPPDAPFGVLKAESFYCPQGQFEPQQVIDGMLPRYEQYKKAGYHGIRTCGEMTWSLKGIPGSERLLEYEVLLGTIGGDFPHSGMCLYDARRFDGAMLFKVLQVHPYMIAHGQLVRNPYYLKPEEFKTELEANS